MSQPPHRRYRVPPNWPPAPEGWYPGPGWEPDPSWGPAPEGWEFWEDVPAAPATVGNAKKQARAERAYRKAQRNWFLRHKILSGIGLIIIIVVISVIATSGGSGSGKGDVATTTAGQTAAAGDQAKTVDHAEDVKISECAAGDLGYATSKVVITNHSSKTSNYLVEISYVSSDGKTQLGTGNVVVNNLDPGQASAPQDAISFQKATGPYTCKVAQITRYAS